MLNMKAFCITLSGILLLSHCPVEAENVTAAAAPTTYPTTIPATTYHTTIPATTYPTTIPATTYPTTIPATTYPTTIPATTYPTNIPATAYPTTTYPTTTYPTMTTAPQSVAATSTGTTITVTWQGTASHYEVEYRHKDVGDFTKNGRVTEKSDTITGVIPGTTYEIRVTAYNSGSGGVSSTPNIEHTVAPAAPSSVSGVSIDRSITVAWVYGDNQISDGYIVYCNPARGSQCSPENGADVPGGDARNTTFTDAMYGQAYNFYVKAYVTPVGGVRIKSDWKNTTTAVRIAGVPTGLTLVEGTSTSVTLRWTRPDNSVLQNYRVVYNSLVGGCTQGTQDTKDDQTTTLTVSPSTPGCTYSFTVISVTSTSQSGPSNTVTYTIAPNAVTNTSVQISGSDLRTLVVTWTYPSDGLYDGVTIYCNASNNESNGPGPVTADKQTTNYNFTALTPGETYHFIISVRSGVMFSSYDPSTAKITLAPSAVSGLTPTAQTTDSITFQWRTDEGRADGFDVTISPDTPPSATIPPHTSSGDVHDITISGLTADTEYTVTVTSKASDGASGFVRGGNQNYTERTLELAPGPVISLNSISITSHEVTITWQAPNPLSSVVAYAVRVLNDGGSCENVTILNCSTCTSRKRESEYSHWWTLLDCGEPATKDIPEVNTSQQFIVELLSPVTSCTIEVTALNTRNMTQYESVDATTDSVSPIIRPINDSVRAELLVSHCVKKNSITFHLPATPEDAGFDTSAGTIREIQILVTQGKSNLDKRNSGTELTWADAQRKGFAGVYAIGDSEDSPENWRTSTGRKRGIVVLSVTVGEDSTCTADGPGYCNGPLKPSTEYCIYLRGFTAGGYADSDCLVLTRTLTDPINIAVPVTVSVVLLVIVCVVTTVICRRRKHCKEGTTTEYDEVANISDPRPVYENTTPNQDPRPVNNNTNPIQDPRQVFENTTPDQDNNNYEMIISSLDYEQLNHHQQTNDSHTYTTFNQG